MWILIPFIGVGKWREKQVTGEVCFGYVRCNMPIRYLNGNVRSVDGYMRMEFGEESGLEIEK